MKFILELQKKLPVDTEYDNYFTLCYFGKSVKIMYFHDRKQICLSWGPYYERRRETWADDSAEGVAEMFMDAVNNPWFQMDIEYVSRWSLPYIEARLSESRDTFFDFAASLHRICQPAFDDTHSLTSGRREYVKGVFERILAVAEQFDVREQCQAMTDRLETNFRAAKELTS